MASCSGIAVKSITSSKVYLKGTVTGLDSSKEYCLHHYYNGDWKNLPNASYGYTHFNNRTSFDLGASGCYIPTSELVEGAQFEVRCHEVSGNCETQVREACTKILYYKVISQYTADFLVRDEDKKTVPGVRIDIAGEVLYTDQYGGANIVLDAGHTYYAQCYAPDGYECDECDESFYLDSDHYTAFWLKKKAAHCLVDIRVLDEDGTGVAGARVNIFGALGATEITTDTWGTATGFTLVSGKEYKAYISYLPLKWVNTADSELVFTPVHDATYTLRVKTAPEVFVCTDGVKRGEETCWDGSRIAKEVCRGNKWVSSGESCPARVCTEGAKRSPETCWDGSVIHKEVCRGNKWVSTGETCPTRPPAPECTNGDKKPGYVCSGGKWVPIGTTPPVPPSECTNGDVKPGFVCSGGKWVPTGTTPPVPPTPGVTPRYLTTAEAIERFRTGLPCYIKCILPILSMLPGIPYTPGAWIPPFCAISTEP